MLEDVGEFSPGQYMRIKGYIGDKFNPLKKLLQLGRAGEHYLCNYVSTIANRVFSITLNLDTSLRQRF